MIDALTTIKVYSPSGGAYTYSGQTDFPITDNCERSAALMGEDYVRLSFQLEEKVVFDAFSFIEYNGQVFFLKERYIPAPNGTEQTTDGVKTTYYTYDVKFVSVANMLDKFICYRHVVVGEHQWDEPEININGTLETLYVIIMGSIKQASARLNPAWFFTAILNAIAKNGIKVVNGVQEPNTDLVKLTAGTKLLTFNFSGENIANVCTTVANNYTKEDKKDTEWYITPITMQNFETCVLHIAKCVNNEKGMQVVSDYITKNDNVVKPYKSGGLKKVEYAQAWSGITNVIVPYGSDRNMSYNSVKGIDEITQMQSTFGKRLRLDPNTTYEVTDKEGNATTIMTDANGAVRNDFVNTGIEQVKFFDDVYPQCHFKVTSVSIRNKRQDGETIPEYTITANPITSSKETLAEEGFYPIKIEEATTLSVRFESGYLNGREFEIANKTSKDQGAITYSLKFTIVADGSIEDGTLIPSGNFIPHVGDEFALFNMKMPSIYISYAKRELAQKAYEELVEVQTKRPEVKCTTDPCDFSGEVAFGNVFKVYSELFNSEDSFVSRVTKYSYKLTQPYDMQFTLASAIMQGTLSSMNDLIADVTNAAGGLEQRAVNLNRRAWRDASEVAEMLDSITAEMMLVGNEKYQFAFTSSIQYGQGRLDIGYGSLQHTQEPYIGYANNGWWEIGETTLEGAYVGGVLYYLDSEEVRDTPFYLYAKVLEESIMAEMVLSDTDYADDTDYLLLGILSSEFEGERVFSRTNGFTAIEGGTITTEQIQDAGRNLIIDFQSNPPKIIARNGAQIIGNFTFLNGESIEDMFSNLDEKADSYDYLKQALQEVSTDGSTVIHGGLLMTNLLRLKDASGNVKAGMSGLNDNILLWGGGDYDDAIALYEGDYGVDITTLLRKDGTGRIGVFYISKDNARISTTDGTIIIDDDEGLKCIRADESEPVVKVTPSELADLSMMRGQTVDTTISLTLETETITATDNIDIILRGVTHRREFTCGNNSTIQFSGGVVFESYDADTEQMDIWTEQDAEENGYPQATGVVVRVLRNGEYIFGGVVNSAARNSFSHTIEEGGTYTIEYYSQVTCKYYGSGDDISPRVTLNGSVTFVYTYERLTKQTSVAYKGIFSYQGDTAYFYYKDGYGLECRVGDVIFKITNSGINIAGLPQSSSGLSSGDLYNAGGTLKIVP